MLQGEHSAILSTFIMLPFSIKTIILSIIKWPLKTGFTVNVFFKYVEIQSEFVSTVKPRCTLLIPILVTLKVICYPVTKYVDRITN